MTALGGRTHLVLEHGQRHYCERNGHRSSNGTGACRCSNAHACHEGTGARDDRDVTRVLQRFARLILE